MVLAIFNKAPICHMLNYPIQIITGHYVDVVFWMVVLDNESQPVYRSEWGQTRCKQQFAVKMLAVFNLTVYHFEVGLLQFPSPLFQPLSKNSQLCVLPPQPPDLLLSLWGAALPLNTRGTNFIIRQCLRQLTPTQQCRTSHKNSYSGESY